MTTPTDRRYRDTHEWHKPDAGLVTIGLSKFAVDELTDITYVGFTKKSGSVKAGETFAEVESVKATSEVYCGIDGEIVEVNQAAVDNPAVLNADPYNQGWLVKIKPTDPNQINSLMTGEQYDRSLA